MVHFYLCCLECYIYIFNSLSTSALFPVSWKKMEPNNKSNFHGENETYVTAMLRPLNPFYSLVRSLVPARFSISGRNCGVQHNQRYLPFMGRGRRNGGLKKVLKQPRQSHLKKPEKNFCWINSSSCTRYISSKIHFLFFQEVYQAVGMEGVVKVCSDVASSCFAVGLLRLSHVVTPGTH